MKGKNKMGKKTLLRIWIMSLLATSSWAAGLGFIIDSDGAPGIDGVADHIYDDAITYEITNAILGTISSPSDLSASYQALWDTDNLYILIEVTDDISSSDSEDTWDDDSIEIYLDADHSQLTSYGPKDYLYSWGWADATIRELAHGATEGVAFASTEQTAGYTLEIKLPWSTLDVTPKGGMQIGLDIHINDDDDGGERDGKLAWHTLINSSDLDPSLFGTAELYTLRTSHNSNLTSDEAPDGEESREPASTETPKETSEEEITQAELASIASHDETSELLTALEQGRPADRTRLDTLVEQVRRDPNLSARERFVVVSRVGGLAIDETDGLTRTTRFAAYETLAKTLVVEFPEEVEPYESLLALANDHPDPVKGKRLARQLQNMAAPDQIKAGAQRTLSRMALVGKPLELSLPDSQGQPLNTQEYRGKVVLLYAWSAMEENSHLWIGDLLRLGSEDLVCIGLNLDPDTQAARAKLSEVALDSLQIYDPEGLSSDLAEQLHLSRVPSIYLIDRNGVLRAVNPWKDELPGKLNALLQEGGCS